MMIRPISHWTMGKMGFRASGKLLTKKILLHFLAIQISQCYYRQEQSPKAKMTKEKQCGLSGFIVYIIIQSAQYSVSVLAEYKELKRLDTSLFFLTRVYTHSYSVSNKIIPHSSFKMYLSPL